ncbi:SRPBCC family protein [Streptomyces sp. NPDC048057]|uniref:SRPBCC family protein n=1 Tax=Streptomyces sp. NPDC048057 TaxID=3155628 RepID=UPI0034031D71
MDWNRYRFRARWDLAAEPGTVYEVLARAEEYPRWWPQVRSVTALSDDTGVVRLRSALPYELTITVRAVRQDPAAGVLEVAMRGDLVGWARWTVTRGGAGTRVRYDQEVEAHKPSMRRLAVPGRPLFRANHAVMMRAGRRGLVALLEERQQI